MTSQTPRDEPGGAPPSARGSVLGLAPAAALAQVVEALSDTTRVRIISVLAHTEPNVGELADALDMSLSAVSHHLRMLRQLKLVRARREGQHVYYALDDAHVLGLYAAGLDHVAHTLAEGEA